MQLFNDAFAHTQQLDNRRKVLANKPVVPVYQPVELRRSKRRKLEDEDALVYLDRIFQRKVPARPRLDFEGQMAAAKAKKAQEAEKIKKARRKIG